MTNVPDDAQQKPTSAEPDCPSQHSASQTQSVHNPDASDCSEANLDSGSGSIDVAVNMVTTLSEPQPDGESRIAEVPEVPVHESSISGGWRNAIQVVLTHRRQTAVAIVLICMAVVYAEDGASTDSDSATESATEMTSVESLLQDFDTLDSQALREPAEPVSQPAGEFQLTVPQSPDHFSAESDSFEKSPSSKAVAVYPDQEPASEFLTGGSLTIPNTTQQTTTTSMPDSGRRKSVRFTGQIQPLK